MVSNKIQIIFITFVALFFLNICIGQRNQLGQKIAYINTEYILANIPAYGKAQEKIDKRIERWNAKINEMEADIKKMEIQLENEMSLLTNSMIKEREIEIENKRNELKQKEDLYFGKNGLLFSMRKELVKPIQDEIIKIIQDISKKSIYNYDMVFDKSGNTSLIYSNGRYDISKLVLKYLLKSKKEIERFEIDEKNRVKKEKKKNQIKNRRR